MCIRDSGPVGALLLAPLGGITAATDTIVGRVLTPVVNALYSQLLQSLVNQDVYKRQTYSILLHQVAQLLVLDLFSCRFHRPQQIRLRVIFGRLGFLFLQFGRVRSFLADLVHCLLYTS